MVTKKLKQIVRNNARIFSLMLGLGLLSVFGFNGNVGATSSAYFLVSPSGGSYAPGSTIGFEIYESAPSSDNVNAVQANLSYTSSLLTYESISINGPFTLCTQQSGGGGSVGIACAATSVQSGEKDIAKVNFKVKSTGTARVAIASSSNIDNTGGNSVWNGALPGGTFTLKSASSSSSSSGGSTNAATTKPTTTTKPKTTTTSPNTTTPTTTTTSNAQSATPATATYTVTVTDSNGQPVNHAQVSLGGNISSYTDSSGKATFTGLSTDTTYDVNITAPGKQPYKSTISLTANEDKLAAAKLSNSSTMNEIIYGGAAAIVIILGVIGYIIYRKRHPQFHAPPISPADSTPPTVSSGNAAPQPPASTSPTAPASRASNYTPRETTQTTARTESTATWPPVIGKNG